MPIYHLPPVGYGMYRLEAEAESDVVLIFKRIPSEHSLMVESDGIEYFIRHNTTDAFWVGSYQKYK